MPPAIRCAGAARSGGGFGRRGDRTPGASKAQPPTSPCILTLLHPACLSSQAADTSDAARPVQVRRAEPPPGAASPLPPDQEARRRAVLARLTQEDEEQVPPPKQPAAEQRQQGQRGEGPPGEPQHLAKRAGSGVAGATKALSGLWGWGASLASKVEAAAASVGREVAETVQDAQPALAAASRRGPGLGGGSMRCRLGCRSVLRPVLRPRIHTGLHGLPLISAEQCPVPHPPMSLPPSHAGLIWRLTPWTACPDPACCTPACLQQGVGQRQGCRVSAGLHAGRAGPHSAGLVGAGHGRGGAQVRSWGDRW